MPIIMSCKIGRFEFPDGTVLSQAKLLRDSIMGQVLSPASGVPRITDYKSARWFADRLDDALSELKFAITFAPEFGGIKETPLIEKVIGFGQSLEEFKQAVSVTHRFFDELNQIGNAAKIADDEMALRIKERYQQSQALVMS